MRRKRPLTRELYRGDNLVAWVDLNGAKTTYVWDSCMLVAVANPLNERTSYTYNRFKSRVTEMNPLGYVTTYNFDNMNRPSGMMDALGNLSTVHYSLNRKVADENALGFRTSYGYDVASRLTSVQDPRGYVWTNVYDSRDLVARMDPLGNLATSVYDKVGRQIASISPLGFRTCCTGFYSCFKWGCTHSADGCFPQCDHRGPVFYGSTESWRICVTQNPK